MQLNEMQIADFLWRHPNVNLEVISRTLTEAGHYIVDGDRTVHVYWPQGADKPCYEFVCQMDPVGWGILP